MDSVLCSQIFKESNIPLVNVKGAHSHALGEFIALGMLYHTKKLEQFMEHKKNKAYQFEQTEMVANKTMLVVGFGDIGAACGRIAKFGFGTRVIGVKRRPEIKTNIECADLIIGIP